MDKYKLANFRPLTKVAIGLIGLTFIGTAIYFYYKGEDSQPEKVATQQVPAEFQGLESKIDSGNCYTVESGDTFYKIWQSLDTHLTLDELADYNKIDDPNLIFPGWEICVPPEEELEDKGSFRYDNFIGSKKPLSDIYSDNVKAWKSEIERWSGHYGIDANLIATLIQIESNGDAKIVSQGGAIGLLQVMPFHQREGEDLFNVDTNTDIGLNILKDCLKESGGSISIALAGYNGGSQAIRWYNGDISREDYINIIESSMPGYGESKAIQVETFVERGTSLYAASQKN